MTTRDVPTTCAAWGVARDWARIELPEAWPDRLRFRRVRQVLLVLAALLRRRAGKVSLPADLPGGAELPPYLLQEFHNLPNGNFSKCITRAYAIGFDRVMLGTLRRARDLAARSFAGCARVLDVGCGAGHLAGALLRHGVAEVWGIDPSPYLLQQAALRHPRAHFAQGLVERTGLPDAGFDGACACFVFHELPARAAREGLGELRRVLRPGARLVLVEPSPAHRTGGLVALARAHGWRGLYFRGLARGVHEPFLAAWDRLDHGAWFAEGGFELVDDRDEMPWRMLSAVRL